VENIISNKARKLHRMKVIEIMDAHTVRIVKQFKWPIANFDGK